MVACRRPTEMSPLPRLKISSVVKEERHEDSVVAPLRRESRVLGRACILSSYSQSRPWFEPDTEAYHFTAKREGQYCIDVVSRVYKAKSPQEVVYLRSAPVRPRTTCCKANNSGTGGTARCDGDLCLERIRPAMKRVGRGKECDDHTRHHFS